MNAKHGNIDEEEINKMIKDIRKFLVNREEFETNQQYLGFEVLFRGFVIRLWFGTDFSNNKYADCNKVLAQLSIQFYVKYQKQQNECNNNVIKQCERIVKWFRNIKRSALTNEYLQVKALY